MERAFIRGSNIRFVIMPDMLQNAPMFKKFGQKAAALPQHANPTARGKSHQQYMRNNRFSNLKISASVGKRKN
jgi:hypothetical protein